jgi:ribosomal protein L37AE/L43A
MPTHKELEIAWQKHDELDDGKPDKDCDKLPGYNKVMGHSRFNPGCKKWADEYANLHPIEKQPGPAPKKSSTPRRICEGCHKPRNEYHKGYELETGGWVCCKKCEDTVYRNIRKQEEQIKLQKYLEQQKKKAEKNSLIERAKGIETITMNENVAVHMEGPMNGGKTEMKIKDGIPADQCCPKCLNPFDEKIWVNEEEFIWRCSACNNFVGQDGKTTEKPTGPGNPFPCSDKKLVEGDTDGKENIQ